MMNWQKLKTLSVDQQLDWAKSQPWAIEMANCAQDSRWHAEGDVWTHTQMVCQQLKQLSAWPTLDAESQNVLSMTALFHDAAKPLTTTIDPTTAAISTPNHAVKGERLARKILRQLECDTRTRESIAKLVRYHGRPNFLSEKEHPENEVIRLSWLLNNQLLYLFALADTRGRDTESMNRPEENLQYWELLSQEQNCLQQPYPFETEHHRFTWAHSEAPNLGYVPHEDFRCTVTMMSGLPGSGKDTWLAQNRPDLPIVSLDRIRRELKIAPTENQGVVAQRAKDLCREHLRAGQAFTFNATNTMSVTRARWLKLFQEYDARIEIVYLEPAWNRLLQQNRERDHVVPESALERLADKLEPPTWLECHDLKFVEPLD